MAYDEKTLKRDGSGITPVPQHFNPTADDYEPILGRNGASRVELYGPDGNPIGADDSNKLAVRATEIESLLNDIKGKDFATQTTLAAILAKIIAAPATEAKQTGILDFVESIALILNQQDFATQSTSAAILAKIITAPSTEAKQDALNALIGEVQAAPTANTLLARLKSLEDKIDAITAGTTPAVTQLSGSKLEEQKTQADAVSNVITFTENIATIEIYHAEATWQTFTVNGLTITVPAGGYRTPVGGTVAKTVTIPSGVNCIVGRLV